jgi:hypothetical protein
LASPDHGQRDIAAVDHDVGRRAPTCNLSAWMMLVTIAGAVANYGDKYIAVRFFTIAELAIYAVPFKFLLRFSPSRPSLSA